MPFKPGQSGNPGGRPKVVGEVQDIARAYTKEAIEALVRVMRDETAPPGAVALAADKLLDRAYGRPAQTIDATLNRRNIQEMSDEELIAIASGVNDDPTADEDVPPSVERH